MLKSNYLSKASLYLLYLSAFLLPLNTHIAVWSLSLFGLLAIVNGILTRSFRQSKKTLLYLGILMMAINICSVFFSDNQKEAWFDIQVKLPLLFFPIVFFFAEPYTKHQRFRWLLTFFSSSLLASLIMLFRAVLNYPEYGISSFFYGYFALFHPTYQAFYFCFAVITGVYFLIKEKEYIGKWRPILMVLTFYFLGIIFLLQSKGAFLSLILVALFLSVYWLKKLKNKWSKLVVVLAFFFGILVVVFQSSRVEAMIGDLKSYSNLTEQERFAKTSSTALRLNIWQCVWEAKNEIAYFGVGNGDIKTLLNQKYRQHQMTYALEKHLNTHNQYLETFVGQGLLGLLVLLIWLVVACVESIKQRDILKLMFMILLIANFLPEAMLNISAGTLFLGFVFYFLFSETRNLKTL